jgi:hypothetical protein
MVGRAFLCLLTVFVGALGCSPSEAPKPVPTVTVTPRGAQIVTTPTPTGPQITPNPGAEQSLTDFSDTANWEWNLAEEAEGPEFEVDADATSYYMPAGNVVTFKAKALNGTPPYTCKWNFGDNSPEQEGLLLKHRFPDPLGQITVWVTCHDASGAVSQVQLNLGITTREDWMTRMGMETPTPGPTP